MRLRWRVWTSRKFCDKCFRSSGKNYWLQRAAAIAVLMLTSILIGRGCRHERPPLIIERPVQSHTQTASEAPPTPPPIEQNYTCGARTKKGKPCSRRVHGPIRCWQHKGLPAMLPLEKLIIKD